MKTIKQVAEEYFNDWYEHQERYMNKKACSNIMTMGFIAGADYVMNQPCESDEAEFEKWLKAEYPGRYLVHGISDDRSKDSWLACAKIKNIQIAKLEKKLTQAEKENSWLLVEYKSAAQINTDNSLLKEKLKVAEFLFDQIAESDLIASNLRSMARYASEKIKAK